ncbi:MAG: aspartate aminotransferase family protein [Chloroflexi bacterium]|nr:aspartate aminotransferase family protein [Chloroflexota bacterium]
MAGAGIRGSASAAIAERAARSIPGGVNTGMRALDPPLAFTRAQGQHLWDADGARYVDFHAAFGPIVLGHADPEVAEAVARATETIDLVGVGVSELETTLAEKVIYHVPSAEKVLFCNSGSEATFHAIRLARAATGRRLVIKFQGCYHGWHDYLGANVISTPDRMGTLDPISAGMPASALDELVVLPFNDPAAFAERARQLGDQVAAVILEPIVHTIGCVVASDEFLATLRRITAEIGAVLIFDEVVTGFRHHLGGYQAISGVTPDLTTLGKAIANGYPLAAVAGRADLMDRFNTRPGGDVFFGGTFNGHPMALAAAMATIERLEDGSIYRRLYRLGDRMRAGLEEITTRLGIEAQPTNFGSVFVCYFAPGPVRSFDDALKNDAERYVGFHRGMIERGFFMLPLNLKRNHLSAAHTEDDVDRALQAAEDTLRALTATGGGA